MSKKSDGAEKQSVDAKEEAVLPFGNRKIESGDSALKQVMYIGPTIKGLIQKNTIYRNGVPDGAAEKVGENTGLNLNLVRPLFCPVEALSGAKEALLDANSKLSVCYQMVLRAKKER